MRRVLIAAGSAPSERELQKKLGGRPYAADAAKLTCVLAENPAASGPRHAVDVTVNASRDVISIFVFTDSAASFTLVNDGPGCHR